MMTVATYMKLREGAEPEWDAAMRERLSSATTRPGFVRSQILIPLDGLDRRVIIGTWATRADWEAWHNDPAFLATRQRLEDLQEGASNSDWHEVIEDQPTAGVGRAVDAALARVRSLADDISRRASGR